MRRMVTVIAALLAVVLTACGAPARHHTRTLPPSVKHACPEALGGHGAMGECGPPATLPNAGLVRAASSSSRGLTFPDFSNNDPCYCGAELRAHGHVGEIDKANQGVGFTDRTFVGMVKDASAHGLAVGGYDFDQNYTAAEAYTFVDRLHAAGIYRNTPRTFPPALDVEFGTPSRAGLEHQLAVLHRAYGRAQIYTGAWYWLPHFGCWVPPNVTFWLSGYPAASVLCGLPDSQWLAHQFTDHGYTGAGQVPFADMSVFRGTASQWATYTHAPRPKPSRATLLRSLRAHEAERLALHRDIDRHHCRRGQHTTPRHPARSRRRYHVLCGKWIIRGLHDIEVIARYRRELHLGLARTASISSIVDRLSTDHVSVEVVAKPIGTTGIHVAIMQNLAGAGVKYLSLPATQTVYTPPKEDPVVDLQATASGKALGGWAGRLQTNPAAREEAERKAAEEAKLAEEAARRKAEEAAALKAQEEAAKRKAEEEAAHASSMIVGVDTGGWGGSLLQEVVSAGIPYLRVQSGAIAAAYSEEPGHIATVTFNGTGGPSSSAATYTAGAVALAKYHPKAIEVVNEPGNPIFWGSGATTDEVEYGKLLEAVHTGLQAIPASERPIELASFDGGYEGDNYGRTLIKDDPHLLELGLGWTVHPYGGHGSASAQGNRARVTEAETATHQGIYVTEVGWPTAVGQPATGDSLQWTEAQQASNITGFISWARSLGYVRIVIVFNGVDYGTNNWYGIEKSSRAHKQSFAALAAAAH